MKMHGMKKMEDGLQSHTVPQKSVAKEKRREWLLDICIAFVKEYLIEHKEIQPLVDQVQELQMCGQNQFNCRADAEGDKTYTFHPGKVKHEVQKHSCVYSLYNKDERDAYGYFHCRAPCGLVFSTRVIRNKCEMNTHPQMTIPQPETEVTNSSEDFLYNYHYAKLVFGLTLLEFDDAIKEGDGERLHDMYKFAHLIYKANGKSKYSYVILLYLVKLGGLVSEKAAHNLKWNRFYNKHGGKRQNIPLDLRMEHMNKIVKTMLKALGYNISETSAERVANTVDPVEMIINGIDDDCARNASVDYRADGRPGIAVAQVTSGLLKLRAFEHHCCSMGHPSFIDVASNILKNLDYRELHSWMTEHMEIWETVYKLIRE